MQESGEGTLRSSNVFSPSFLHQVQQGDEPPTAVEADLAGPWEVHPIPGGWGVFREGETPERDAVPVADFRHRSIALLGAAILPGLGRDALFTLRKAPDLYGHAVESGGRVVGHLRVFDEDFVIALHVVETILRSPRCLARLLEAAGSIALKEAGRLLMLALGGRRKQ